MKKLKTEFKKLVTGLLLNFAFEICPNGKFKNEFAKFLLQNIKEL